jgi:hypothetical protein
MQCLKDKLLNNLNILNEKLQNEKIQLEHMQNKLYNDAINNEEEEMVEGFFDGLSSFFSSTPNNGLPVAPGTLEKQNINILEQKISDKMKRSSSFPPNDDDDKKKDSDNNELLNSINKGKKINKTDFSNNLIPNSNINTNKITNKTIENLDTIKPMNNQMNTSNCTKPISNNVNPMTLTDSSENKKLLSVANTKENTKQNVVNTKQNVVNTNKKDNLKDILGSCNFFNDKCPDDYQPLGNFSISGSGNNTILTCGTVDKVKPAHAFAIIKNNSIYEITVIDPGFGFNPKNPPKIYIEGGKGNGASAEAVIDDNGYLKIIKIINPGYNYTETPNIIIDAPFMNSSCHLCCKI